jgi:hypothetical protein
MDQRGQRGSVDQQAVGLGDARASKSQAQANAAVHRRLTTPPLVALTRLLVPALATVLLKLQARDR